MTRGSRAFPEKIPILEEKSFATGGQKREGKKGRCQKKGAIRTIGAGLFWVVVFLGGRVTVMQLPCDCHVRSPRPGSYRPADDVNLILELRLGTDTELSTSV